jgi:hypothetical protein
MMKSPLSLTMNPKLDAAMAEGYDAWERAAREVGLTRTVAWASQRAGEEVPKDDLREHVEALLEAEDEDAATFARAELAELVEENDDELADLLWERVLRRGLETDDPDLIFESSSRLAGIAEDLGEVLAAAEYFVDFLNWRRQPSSVSDPESVQTAFEEVIRLAELDGEPKIAAIYSFRQAQYTKLVDSEAEQASSGDWEKDRAPYVSWS